MRAGGRVCKTAAATKGTRTIMNMEQHGHKRRLQLFLTSALLSTKTVSAG